MKRLIIMRHCKSDWKSGAQSDHDRPLNPRGQRSAAALGQWLRDKGHLPDAVICSSATRTRETLQGLALPDGTAQTVTRDLYLAEPWEMLELLRGAQGSTVLMIGHNPGCAALASELVSDWPAHPDFPRYPTGATLVLDFDVASWAKVETTRGTTVDFVVPRDLTGAED